MSRSSSQQQSSRGEDLKRDYYIGIVNLRSIKCRKFNVFSVEIVEGGDTPLAKRVLQALVAKVHTIDMIPVKTHEDGDTLLAKGVLHALEVLSSEDDLASVGRWLNGGRRVQLLLFDTPRKKPSDASRSSLQTSKSTRPKELCFLLTLSNLLQIDELAADDLLKEYCQEQVLGCREGSTQTLDLESLRTLELVRDYYYDQQQLLWKILQELLRIDKDDDHQSLDIARKAIQFLVGNNLLETILLRITNSQKWQLQTLSKSDFLPFIGTEAPFTLLDNRCSDFLGRHMLASAEFVANDLGRALETLILLLYSHSSLSLNQLEVLMIGGGRDMYGVPGGCVQVVKAILGQDYTVRVPFLVYSEDKLPDAQAAQHRLGEQLAVKYVTVFAESLQFWRALQQSSDGEKQTHPLLHDYVHTNMMRFTTDFQGSHMKAIAVKGGGGGSKVHTVMYFLWGLFLEMFGGSRRVENVLRPPEFADWISSDQYGRRAVEDRDRTYHGGNDEMSATGTTAVEILSDTISNGAVESLVSILSRGIGLRNQCSDGATATGLGSILGINQYSSSLSAVSIDISQEGIGGADLSLVCTVLQEVVNVIISAVCLAHGSIDQMLDVAVLVELTHRGDEDLCEGFWTEWHKRRNQSDRTNKSTKCSYHLCRLLEILLENTPHDSTYLFAILSSLVSSPSKCADILEILNQQVAIVKWTSVRDLLFLETDYDSGGGREGDQQWVDIFTWKEGKSSFIGANVICSTPISSRSGRGVDSLHGILKDVSLPQQGSRGVVCDVATDGSEGLLVRWVDQIVWWGVILDIVSQSPAVAQSLIATTELDKVSKGRSSPEAVRASVTLDFLATLMKKQSLLTVFYLESKSEQLLLHSVLSDIGGSHLFNSLSSANETIGRILNNPQNSYLRMISDDIGIPEEEAVKLITLLQEYAKNSGSDIFRVMKQIGTDAVGHSSIVTVESNAVLNTPLMLLSDAVVAVVTTLSVSASVNSSGSVSGISTINFNDRQLMERGTDTKVQGNSILNSFFASALRFLTSFASSSTTRTLVVCKELSRTFDMGGPRSFVEVMYRIANTGDGRSTLGERRSIEITSEICTLLCTMLESIHTHNIVCPPSTQHFLLSAVTFIVTLFIDLQNNSSGSNEQTLMSLTGWRGMLSQKCLSLIQFILSHTIASQNNSNQDMRNDSDNTDGKIFDSISAILFQKLTQDPQLIRSILRVATSISISAIMKTPFEQASVIKTVNPPKRVYKTNVKQRKNDSSVVLPIDYSYCLSDLTSSEADTCVTMASNAVDILSLVIDIHVKYQPATLPYLSSMFGGRVDLPVGGGIGTDRPLGGCTYLILLCGLIQAPDLLTLGIPHALELRYNALRLITLLVLITPHCPVDSPSLVDIIGLFGLRELCHSICDTMIMSDIPIERRIVIAVFDLLLAIGNEQPATMVLLLNVREENIIEAQSSSSSSSLLSPVSPTSEPKLGVLLAAIHSLLIHAKILYKQHPLLLHKLYEYVLLLWRNSSSLRPLAQAAIQLIQFEPNFFTLVAVPLSHKLPDVPSFVPRQSTTKGSNNSIIIHDPSNTNTQDCTTSVRDTLTAAMGGTDVSLLLLNSKKGLRSIEKSSTEYFHTLLVHASSLQLLAMERHGHLFSMDSTTARKIDLEMRNFFIKATEMNHFFSWLTSYMRVDINDANDVEVSKEAKNIGITLSGLVHQSSHVTGSLVGAKTQYGHRYIYDTNLMHKKLVTVFESHCLNIDEDTSLECVAEPLEAWIALDRKIHLLNLQWSLSDAQLILLQSWKVFIQIFVLPGSNARQLAFKVQYESNGRGIKKGGEGWTPPASPCVGSLSPSFDPITGSPSEASNSNFAGDKRSYEVVEEIAKHLNAATIVSTTTNTNTHTNTNSNSNTHSTTKQSASASAFIGIGAARVVLEKCELLASMLHHQLREVLLRASDPRRSQVDSRNLGSSRLGPEKMKSLLVTLSTCYTAIMYGLEDANVYQMSSINKYKLGIKQIDTHPQELRSAIQRELFIAILLTLRGIVQLNASPLFPTKYGIIEENSLDSSSLSQVGFVRLQIFRLAATALRDQNNQNTAQNGQNGQNSYNRSDTGAGSLFVIALRLMKCCLPSNINGLSLAVTQAWNAEVLGPHMVLPLSLTGLLKSLSISAVEEGVVFRDHDYSQWAVNTVCGVQGSSVAPLPQGIEKHNVSHLSSSSVSSSSTSTSSVSASTSASAIFALLDVIHGGLSSGVLPLSVMVGKCGILNVICSLGIFQEMQRVLVTQNPSRSATLSGYSSITGEIADLSNCWERAVDIVYLVLSLSAVRLADISTNMQEDLEKSQEHAVISEIIFDGVLSFLQTFGPLLLLPLTQSFSEGCGDISRLTLRRVRMCRSSVTLFHLVTQQCRVWKAVLPAYYDAIVREVLRAAALFITLLTDIDLEDKGPAHPVVVEEETEEEKTAVSTPGGSVLNSKGMNNNLNKSHLPKKILGHILAVTEGDKEGVQINSTQKKRRATQSSEENDEFKSDNFSTGLLGKKAGLRVTFGEDIQESNLNNLNSTDRGSSSSLGSAMSGLGGLRKTGPRYGPRSTISPHDMREKESNEEEISPLFVLRMEKELVSCLVSILLLIKEIDDSSSGLYDQFGSSVCVGSKVFYYSRAYENATRSLQLLEGMIVAINPYGEKNYTGGMGNFEVVLANGAREFDVNPSDVVYSQSPLMSYQRLSIPLSYEINQDYFTSSQKVRYNFILSDPLTKVSIQNSMIKEEIWTGRGLEVISMGGLTPTTMTSRGYPLGEESCTSAHLLRILSYATSKISQTHLSGESTASSSSSPYSVNSSSYPTTPVSSYSLNTTIASQPLSKGMESELEILGGLSSWLCLGVISHHARAFEPRRADPATEYVGGRPDMIEQLEFLKCFVKGDSSVLNPPAWLVSDGWKQYSECVTVAAELVIEKLRDEIIPNVATPEVVPVIQKKGTKIGLRSKLHFVSTPEEL